MGADDDSMGLDVGGTDEDESGVAGVGEIDGAGLELAAAVVFIIGVEEAERLPPLDAIVVAPAPVVCGVDEGSTPVVASSSPSG